MFMDSIMKYPLPVEQHNKLDSYKSKDMGDSERMGGTCMEMTSGSKLETNLEKSG